MYATSDVEASPQRSTIREVAREAGVSTATVSRVLNENAHVSADTRALVLQAIQRHGLTARRRGRARLQAGMVTVRCPYLLDEYFGVILSSVAWSLRQRGKGVLLSAEAKEGNEPSLSELLRPDTTEGAVLILPPEPSELLTNSARPGVPLRRHRPPHCLADRHRRGVGGPHVGCPYRH